MSNFNDFNLENQPEPEHYWIDPFSDEASYEKLEQKMEEEYYSELEEEYKEAKKEALETYHEWLEKQEGVEDDDLPF